MYEFEGKRPSIDPSAFISDSAVIIGDVTIGARCYVGPGSVIRRDDCMEVSVTDNGRRYHPGSIPATGRDTGTGLRLLSRSIEIMNQYNRRAATLDIQNLPEPRHGTRIELLIPLTYSFQF